ncbi:beta-glucosidase 17 [Morus notabilis]|uniref:beta-glucosidase 17 n=1 Tax=Morus notabilis TaxID=981085 RepID=UPI000CED4B04|nr:beta-glucosidase 17 [Morus notabilis]
MRTHLIVLFNLVIVAYLLTCSKGVQDQLNEECLSLNRSCFPPDFIFGTASSAYQYEGAASEEYGKEPSIWDTFTKEHPEKIPDGSSGEVANDFYHRYKDDIRMIKQLGFESFRLSISWSRILPRGTISGGVNFDGINFYNNLIDDLLQNGIKPIVTLFHWDLPQALEDKYRGFLSPDIVEDYHDYANLCFAQYGDRVKHWTTFNEPYIFSTQGYESGVMAPGRCSDYAGNCPNGDSGTEPYKVVHHILLAHADVVDLYRKKFQPTQNGIIGLVETSQWAEPKFQTLESRKAAKRALDFMHGWVFDPIVFGDYSKIMRSLVGHRLPKFTDAQSELLKGSYDFLGLNYYTARYADDSNDNVSSHNPRPANDMHVNLTIEGSDGRPIGPQTPTSWLLIYPKGIEDLVLYLKEKYNNPPLYITENGVVDTPDVKRGILDTFIPNDWLVDDRVRIKYHHDHLSHLLNAIKAGADVRGYYAWTFQDVFEWNSGFTSKFGLVHIDRDNNLTRTRKGAADWFEHTFFGKSQALILDQQPTLLASA